MLVACRGAFWEGSHKIEREASSMQANHNCFLI